MRATLARLVPLFAATWLAACSSPSETYVVVEVERGVTSGDPTTIDLELAFNAESLTRTLSLPGSAPIPLPATAGFHILHGEGPIMVTAVARDGAGVEMSRGMTTGTVVRGDTTTVTVTLGVIDMPDGPPADGAPDGPPDAPVEALLAIDSTSHDFGSVVLGSSSVEAVFTVSNEGIAPSGTIATSVISTGSVYQIVTDDCAGVTLAGAASCEIHVVFTPVAEGAAPQGTLRASASPGGSVTAVLDGTGVLPGALSIEPDTRDFGSVVIGTSSGSSTFLVTNTGGVATGMITTSLTGSDAGEFTVTSDGCDGQALDPSSTCTVTVQFSPTAAGSKSASLGVSADPGGTATAGLSGVGLTPGALSISPTSHDFGSTLAGTLGSTWDFVVTNTGGTATSVLATSLTGDSGDFFMLLDACDGATLNGGSSCTIRIRFTPQTSGDKAAGLSVTATMGGSTAASLTGVGLAPALVAINPTSQDYGTVVTGNSSQVIFEVSNDGGVATGTLTTALGGPDAGQFSIMTNGCAGATLAPAATCQLTVRFAPSSAGMKNAALAVSATPGGMVSAPLSGLAVAPGQLTIAPTSHDYMGVLIGSTSVRMFSVTNTGGTTTGAITVGLSGSGSSHFSITTDGCSSTTLAPAASCAVAVTFAPSSAGSKTASLDVSATPGGGVAASLSGTGLRQALLTISPTSHAFADTPLGQNSATKDFVVTNTGDVASGVPTTSLGGTNPSDFAITGNTCSSVLAASGSCTVTVRFSPQIPGGAGAKDASLNVSATPGGTAAATLSGRAITPANLTVSSVDFGTVTLNGTDIVVLRSAIVTNTGQQTSGTVTLAITGTDAADFQLYASVAMSDCQNGVTVLAGGASCTAQLGFAPTSRGMKTAGLQASATPGGSATGTLTGTALQDATLASSPSSNSFGNIDVGQASLGVMWIIRNDGDVATGNLTITGAGSDFTVSGCSGVSIGPMGSCTAIVRFAPASGGFKNVTIMAAAGPGGSTSISVTGTGTFRLTVSASGAGNGTITSNVGGINCSWVAGGGGTGTLTGTCAASYTPGSGVILQARTQNGQNSHFEGWSTVGACSGAGSFHDCNVTMDAHKGTTAVFQSNIYDLVFVSSTIQNKQAGSARAYDATCNTLATAAGINELGGNAFMAWTSDTSSNAGSVLAASGARGFIRLDGVPFGDTQTSIFTNNVIWNPIRIDENGQDVGDVSVFTGTSSNGTADGTLTCSNWTSNSGSSRDGATHGGPVKWTSGTIAPCSIGGRVFCVMKTKSALLGPTTTSGKRVYLTNSVFKPGGDGSPPLTPDGKCAAEKPASIAGAVRALVVTPTMTAAGVVSPGAAYVRMDGVYVGTGADLLAAARLKSGIWQTGNGTYPSDNNGYVWTGNQTNPGMLGGSNTCTSWTSNLGTVSGETGQSGWASAGGWWTRGPQFCNDTGVRLICVEQ